MFCSCGFNMVHESGGEESRYTCEACAKVTTEIGNCKDCESWDTGKNKISFGICRSEKWVVSGTEAPSSGEVVMFADHYDPIEVECLMNEMFGCIHFKKKPTV